MAILMFVVLVLLILLDLLVLYKLYRILKINKQEMKEYISNFRYEIATNNVGMDDRIEKSVAKALEKNKKYRKKDKEVVDAGKKIDMRFK